MKHKFFEETIASKSIFEGRVIKLQVDEVKLPNGKTSTREIVKHPGACCVLAITQDQKVLLVEQYRKACERSLIEIPAGKLDNGEDPKEAAIRELEEETGYKPGKISKISEFYTAPGFCDELIHLYLAEDLEIVEDSACLDEDEFVDLIESPIDDAVRMVTDGRIVDAKTVIALQYLALIKLHNK